MPKIPYNTLKSSMKWYNRIHFVASIETFCVYIFAFYTNLIDKECTDFLLFTLPALKEACILASWKTKKTPKDRSV